MDVLQSTLLSLWMCMSTHTDLQINYRFANSPFHVGEDGGGSSSQKNILLRITWHVHICTEKLFPNTHSMGGMGWINFQKEMIFARNWMKFSDWHKCIFHNPPLYGVGSIFQQNIFLLGTEWNFQIYNEILCLPALHPMGAGERLGVKCHKTVCKRNEWNTDQHKFATPTPYRCWSLK